MEKKYEAKVRVLDGFPIPAGKTKVKESFKILNYGKMISRWEIKTDKDGNVIDIKKIIINKNKNN